MGLDITAFKNLTVAVGVSLETAEDEYETYFVPGASMEWSESVWPGRGEPIDPLAIYTFENSMRFRAGSYGGYGRWRDLLRQFSANLSGNPFKELIEFADNQGVIGSVISKKLAVDFTEHYDAFTEFCYAQDRYDEGRSIPRYEDWKAAFEMASDNGAVDFH